MYNDTQKSTNTTQITRKNAVAFINLTLEDANGVEHKVNKGAPIQADSLNRVDRSLLNKARAAHKAGQPNIEFMFKGTINLVGLEDLAFEPLPSSLAANETINTETGEVTTDSGKSQEQKAG